VATFLAAAAAGVTNLARELADILGLRAAHGEPALLAALRRVVTFRRRGADDLRSILAAAGAAPTPRPAGEALMLTVPQVSTGRSRRFRVPARQHLWHRKKARSSAKLKESRLELEGQFVSESNKPLGFVLNCVDRTARRVSAGVAGPPPRSGSRSRG
jgi:hypothetical protein